MTELNKSMDQHREWERIRLEISDQLRMIEGARTLTGECIATAKESIALDNEIEQIYKDIYFDRLSDATPAQNIKEAQNHLVKHREKMKKWLADKTQDLKCVEKEYREVKAKQRAL